MKLLEGTTKRLAPGCWPLWSSDGWELYLCALTLVFAVLIHFIKGKGPGRPKESQVVPDPRVRLRASCQTARSRGVCTLKGKTPAQAAGLSDHCWTLRELLTFKAHPGQTGHQRTTMQSRAKGAKLC
jgi:hypothetical protein